MPTRSHTLQVELASESADRSYPIVIGQDLLQDAGLFDELLIDRPVVLVSNDTISPLYAAQVCRALGEARQVTQVVLPDGEVHKNLESIDLILSAALADKHERRTVFLALGGGVVGDLTGFAAACFLRGVDFIQLPTTLLAQVDSSVGGKTGVNHSAGKNLIGAFHQPLAVLIDLQTLRTLPAREYAAGIAEIIKYGCICDAGFFDWLTSVSDGLVARRDLVLAEAIKRSCAIKARVVAADEREAGVRAHLNFGHTFGHAIEKVQGYGEWLHGEAVACGMVIATKISVNRGYILPEVLDRLTTFLERFNLPISPPPDMDADAFLAAMAGDKKVAKGKIRYILLGSLGDAIIVDDISHHEIGDALTSLVKIG